MCHPAAHSSTRPHRMMYMWAAQCVRKAKFKQPAHFHPYAHTHTPKLCTKTIFDKILVRSPGAHTHILTHTHARPHWDRERTQLMVLVVNIPADADAGWMIPSPHKQRVEQYPCSCSPGRARRVRQNNPFCADDDDDGGPHSHKTQ